MNQVASDSENKNLKATIEDLNVDQLVKNIRNDEGMMNSYKTDTGTAS